jgi:hypothetical protein
MINWTAMEKCDKSDIMIKLKTFLDSSSHAGSSDMIMACIQEVSVWTSVKASAILTEAFFSFSQHLHTGII